MHKQKYTKYLKKNIFGEKLKICEDDYISNFTEIQKDGFQNCGIYVSNEELVKCENMNEGRIINKNYFLYLTNKLSEIKKTSERGLLPIIYSYCIKDIDGVTNFYTKMQKLDGDITDFLFKKLPEIIINAKYIEYKQDFNMIISKILNPILQTPQEQQSIPPTPNAPFHRFDDNDFITPPRRPMFDDSDDDVDFILPSRSLFGGTIILNEFDNFIQDYERYYNMHLEQINKKTINITRILYNNNLIDSDGYIPQNYGYKLVDEQIEDDFEYGYSTKDEIKELNLNVLLYKIDFMSLEIIKNKQKEFFGKFQFNYLDNNRHNFLSKYYNMTEPQKE